jgi:superfamily II DNA/RNA helicase
MARPSARWRWTRPTLENLHALGYLEMTPIQAASLPAALPART